MDETIQSLRKVKALAMEKSALDTQIFKLKQQLHRRENLKPMKVEPPQATLSKSKYILIFAGLDILLGALLDRVVHLYVTLTFGQGFDFPLALRYVMTGGPLYIFPVRVILGLPFAIIIILIIRAAIKAKNRRASKKTMMENKEIADENKQYIERNLKVDNYNNGFLTEIKKLEGAREQVLAQFHNMAPWYPESYFDSKIVDYMINQLETKKAISINQAIVHYEAGKYL